MTAVLSKTETTLADLAALAGESVPGFKRPESGMCAGCGYEMGYCCCSKDEPEWDNSPAALAMAVLRHGALLIEVHPVYAACLGPGRDDSEEEHHDGTPEGIARALLTALLRAHGVEVADAVRTAD